MKNTPQRSPIFLASAGLLCFLVACGMEPWASMPYKSDLEVARLSDGTKIRYAIAKPPLLKPEGSLPVVIAMPLGIETYRNVSLTISEIWQPVAEENGWVVVSPAEPDERFFWQDKWLYGKGGETHFPEFLAHLDRIYNASSGKYHMVSLGHNGDGAVACVLAAPEKFASVTLVPYFRPETDGMTLLGQEPKIRTTVLLSDQAAHWKRNGGRVSFAAPGVVVEMVPMPDPLAEEGIGALLEALPSVCDKISAALN